MWHSAEASVPDREPGRWTGLPQGMEPGQGSHPRDSACHQPLTFSLFPAQLFSSFFFFFK